MDKTYFPHKVVIVTTENEEEKWAEGKFGYLANNNSQVEVIDQNGNIQIIKGKCWMHEWPNDTITENDWQSIQNTIELYKCNNRIKQIRHTIKIINQATILTSIFDLTNLIKKTKKSISQLPTQEQFHQLYLNSTLNKIDQYTSSNNMKKHKEKKLFDKIKNYLLSESDYQKILLETKNNEKEKEEKIWNFFLHRTGI